MQSLRHPQLNMLALVNRIQPMPVELSSARLHRAAVRSRLSKSFDVSGIHNIGSHARGTAIRRHSDLDLMVVLRKEEVLWGGKMTSSETVIRNVLNELRDRFPLSDIRKDGLAAALAFGSTKQSLDVVPAVFERFDRQGHRPVFLIPDGNGGWMETCPHVHDAHFEKAHAGSGNKLARVSQLIKWWKHARTPSLPIGSFYSDMVLASLDICVGAKTYGQCLHDFFAVLSKGRCGFLNDPCGIAGRISATKTDAQREQLQNSVEHARAHAAAALEAQKRGHSSEANRQWNIVFNDCF